jgi:NAD(P)-dependent dehydrogenase (short-subunit alcohol dehydrogenase family)
MADNKRFSGKVAIVTGAANGIGRACAQRLADEGAAVAVLDLDAAGAEEAAKALPDAIGLGVDVADDVAVCAAVEAVVARWGGVDILVNNAGGSLRPPAKFWEFSTEDIRWVTDVNYLSQLFCIKAVMPSMRARGGGSILNIASGSGIRTVVGMAVYGAAKAAVINMTRAAAQELGEFGIRVNAIAPGYIRFTRRKANFTDAQQQGLEDQAMASQALKQVGVVEDIAAAVAFFCSQDARHITGQILPINGGTQT